jgi:hypothetical protein
MQDCQSQILSSEDESFFHSSLMHEHDTSLAYNPNSETQQPSSLSPSSQVTLYFMLIPFSGHTMGFWFCDRVHDYPCSLAMQLFNDPDAPLRIATLPTLLMMLVFIEILYTFFLCTLFPCLTQLRLPNPFYESEDDKQLQNSHVRRKRMEEVVPIRKSGQENDACCSICLHSYDPAQQVACSPVCRHIFHKECLFLWLEHHETCPCCRQEFLQAKGCCSSNPSC